MKYEKYDLYERSVQSAEHHAQWFMSIYKDLNSGKYPRHLREDFCGTFQISCEWVKRNRQNTALAVDLDPEPLAYGKRKNYAKLSQEQKSRLEISQSNVLVPTQPKRDVIVAGNFSFFHFQEEGRASQLLPKLREISEDRGNPHSRKRRRSGNDLEERRKKDSRPIKDLEVRLHLGPEEF